MRRIIVFTVCLLMTCGAMAQHVSYQSTKHYNAKVAEFEEKYDEIDSTKIVMLGNSLTEGGGDWNQLIDADSLIVNRGISGDCAKGISERLLQILPKHPKAIFLMCGINDLSHGLTAQKVADLCIGVVRQIRQGSPETKLYLLGLLPFDEDSRWTTLKGRSADVPVINSLLADYCTANDITFINMYSKFTRGDSMVLNKPLSRDGLHVNATGYKIWAAEIAPYIAVERK